MSVHLRCCVTDSESWQEARAGIQELVDKAMIQIREHQATLPPLPHPGMEYRTTITEGPTRGNYIVHFTPAWKLGTVNNPYPPED